MPVRKRAIEAALRAADEFLAQEGYALTRLARCELLFVALDERTNGYDWVRPEPTVQ